MFKRYLNVKIYKKNPLHLHSICYSQCLCDKGVILCVINITKVDKNIVDISR